jgi:RepB DNA-primase from phage plasmid
LKPDIHFEMKSLSSLEYTLALHEPEDQVAVVLVNRFRGQSLQRIASAEAIAAPDFQRGLADRNRAGYDVFVGMNPLKEGVASRTKESIREIRHVYLDLDEDADAALANVRNSLDVPAPNFVLGTSRAKHQVVWKIEGVSLQQAESLLHALANQFGGDAAATDATRVLRMPGFVNHKYPGGLEFLVQARQESNRVYTLRDFSFYDDSPDVDRYIAQTLRPARRLPAGHRSQSEADWAYAKRALARGVDPEQIIQRIADYRAADKPDPLYYARHTVEKAQADSDERANLRAESATRTFPTEPRMLDKR